MIWEFGELGYDNSINRCLDGSINDSCRLTAKPIRWDYLQQVQRKRLYDIYSSLLKLKSHGWYKDVFTANNITITRSMGSAFKWLTVRSATDSSMLCVIGNFDVLSQTGSFTFPVGGTWYDYLNGNTITASGSVQNITLQPGEFHVYLNRNLINAVVTAVPGTANQTNEWWSNVYPNPVVTNSVIDINVAQTGMIEISLVNQMGQQIGTVFKGTLAKGKHSLSLPDKINNLPAGTYLLRIQAGNKALTEKIVVQ